MKNKLFVIAYFVFLILIVIHMNGLITSRPIENDALQNLAMAFNYYKYNTFSKSENNSANPRPTNYREPFPPFIYGIFMHIHPEIKKNDPFSSFVSGKNTVHIKQVNLFWIFFLLLGAGIFIYRLTKNRYLPFITLMLVFMYFIRFGNHFDMLNTELEAATLIIFCSYFLYESISQKTFPLKFLTGLVYGLLILTKAVFLYLSLPIFGLLLFYQYKDRAKGDDLQTALKWVSPYVFGILLFISPWIIRNYIHFQEFSITQRGGAVLYRRVIYNQMNSDEYFASFYFYGPTSFKMLINLLWDSPTQQDFERGGSYERLNPSFPVDELASRSGIQDIAVSFRGKMQAERQYLQNIFISRGSDDPKLDANKKLGEKGKKLIIQNFHKHSLLIPVMFWRGMWCFPNTTLPFIGTTLKHIINDTINLISVVSLFFVFVISFFRKKSCVTLSITILPVGMILFYATFSHFIPRYSEPAIPIMLVIVVYLTYKIVHRHSLKKKEKVLYL